MKIALVQLNYTIGDFALNSRKIIAAIKEARELQADLVVFAELSVCGYPPRDFLGFDDFIDCCNKAVLMIAEECKGIAAIIGTPTHNPADRGKRLFNSAMLLRDGKISSVVSKALLPTYDIFDEYRYFEPNRHFEVVEFMGIKIALTICEDIWSIGEDPLYVMTPMDELIAENPDLLINIAASPFTYSQEESRNAVLRANALKYHIPLIYVNHVGAQTELLFDGNSKVMNADGQTVKTMKAFSEDFMLVELDETQHLFTSVAETYTGITNNSKTALIHDALLMGISDYFRKMGFQKAILGLSGGIDSALTLVLAAKALGPLNVKAVLLPSAFSSGHSVDDALKLAENLGVPYEIIGIQDTYESLLLTLQPQFQGLAFNIAEENIQARVRAIILMAMANKFGFILLNTSNKSEAAVGYGTLYGDMCGGISVLGDVYKTEVYELANYINSEREIIPVNSIEKPPSAELRPDQRDSDSLPDYAILDQILYNYIELQKGPGEIIEAGFDEPTVTRVLRMVNMNEWKRYQTPPILRVSPKAFGSGRRMPIVARYLS